MSSLFKTEYFYVNSVLVGTILQYFDIGTLRSTVTASSAFSISGTAFVGGAATICCEHKLGMPVLVDSSGTVAPLESLLAMLLSPLWRAILPFGCGISAMALLEIADLLFQVLNDDQRLSWLGFLLRTFAVGNGHKYELIWLRHRVSESNVGWRPTSSRSANGKFPPRPRCCRSILLSDCFRIRQRRSDSVCFLTRQVFWSCCCSCCR